MGPQTFRRVVLLLSGRIDIFTVRFTATGLHALLGVPMTELTDAGVDGAALFGGRAIEDLLDRLAAAGDFASRVQIADAFVIDRLARRHRSPMIEPIAAALARIGSFAGVAAVADLSSTSGLSERQFRRRFEQQVGIAPKRYARIVRLEAAIAARAATPDRSLTDIAHDLGWFDQAHMDKDFRALVGAAPSTYFARSTRSL